MRMPAKLLPIVNACMCVALLALLLADAIWPLANIFLNPFVKVFLLLTCLLSAVCGGLLIARQRKREAGARRTRRAR